MAEDVWTVKRILAWIEGYLAQRGDESSRVSSQWLVSEALGVSRMQLFLDAERPLAPGERGVLRGWTKRRAAGEPLQYITGSAAFRHITVKVRPGVLIPRPETEVLVSEALALLPEAPKPQDELDAELLRRFAELECASGSEEGAIRGDSDNGRRASSVAENATATVADGVRGGAGKGDRDLLVADIGTGSGCIACSIASENPMVSVIATDISPEAVALAGENAFDLGLQDRVKVVQCDLGEGVESALLGDFDLVVSNPPYIPTGVLGEISREVADFEPRLALDGGIDGLATFRRLLEWCQVALKPGGALAFELHETCLEEARVETAEAGFCDVKVCKDLAERPRVITARKRIG